MLQRSGIARSGLHRLDRRTAPAGCSTWPATPERMLPCRCRDRAPSSSRRRCDLVRPADRLLVLVNGAYGEAHSDDRSPNRDARWRSCAWPEGQPVEAEPVAEVLRRDPGLTHVALVHCETTTGLLNPLQEIAAVAAAEAATFCWTR